MDTNNLKQVVNTSFGWVTKLGIVLAILASFFLFTNLTTEFFDSSKFIILLVVSLILLVLITLKFILNNKVTITRTPLDIPFLLILAAGIVGTVLSPAPFISLLGSQVKLHGSLISLIVYTIFYFVTVNSFKSAKDVKQILFLSTLAAGILSIVTLLAYAGVKLLPPPWTYGINFTPSGSSFSTTAILALLIPVTTSRLFVSKNPATLALNSAFLTLFVVTIALTGTFSTWLAALLGLVLTVATSPLVRIRSISQIKPISMVAIIVPIAAVILITTLSLIPPLSGAKNPLYTQAKTFPHDLQLDFANSWKIAASSFRDAPFWGSGPATFLFDFTNYKPIEFNNLKNWNLRFDSAFNEYLQVFATLGAVGLIGLVSLTALFVSVAWKPIIGNSEETSKELAISGLLFFVILALHASTLTLWVFGIIILAGFMVINQSAQSTRSWWNSNSIQRSILQTAQNVSAKTSEETISVAALPSVLLTLSVGLTLFTLFFAAKMALADYHHRVALNAIDTNQGIVAYNELIVAEKLNPQNDLYRTDLAQINFALANAIAQAKAPSQASPSGSLTAQDKQNIQVLLQQSINEGRIATALSPKSALNWEILGLLYRQIAGVAPNALVFSLDSFGKAIYQDPLNPQLRLSVGGVYYATGNFDQAIRFFTDAINLKPDLANGYYNLSIALRDKGDLVNAQALAEKLLTLVDKNSNDYKVAADYLEELKKKATTSSTTTPPASQTSGALQDEKLPKVVNVGNPPANIATPSAIKKPNPTPSPTPTP